MGLFTAIDLSRFSQLPPNLVEEFDVEKLTDAFKDDLRAELTALELDADTILDEELIKVMLEAFAEREYKLRQRINEASRSVLLATATGPELDHIAAIYGIQRQTIDEENKEDDERLRYRTRIALEGLTNAGSRGSYQTLALAADSNVKDVNVYSNPDQYSEAGTVRIIVLSDQNDGNPELTVVKDEETQEAITLTEKVKRNLTIENLRPLTDKVVVLPASIIHYNIDITIVLEDTETDLVNLRQELTNNYQKFVAAQHGFSLSITLSSIFAILRELELEKNLTIKKTQLKEPIQDINVNQNQAAFCDNINVTIQTFSGELSPPLHNASSLDVSDLSFDDGLLNGEISIGPAMDESDLTHYVVYWGDVNKKIIKYVPVIKTFAKEETLIYEFVNQDVPLLAKYLLVFTANQALDGTYVLAEQPIAELIDDQPNQPATSIEFEDTNSIPNVISGKVFVGKAEDEANIDTYKLYWSNDGIHADTFIAKQDANDEDIIFVLTNEVIPIPMQANYLMVVTANDRGEMATGVSVEVIDLAFPQENAQGLTFDNDTNEQLGIITGTLTIRKATDETTITNYHLYWGSDAQTKLPEIPFKNFIANGGDINEVFTDEMIPEGATHWLVFAAYGDNEYQQPVSLAIPDKARPVHMAQSIQFVDINIYRTQLSGEISIQRAADESDITYYALYWAKETIIDDESTLTKGPKIVELPVSSGDENHVYYHFDNEEGAFDITRDGIGNIIGFTVLYTHLLVVTGNVVGEMETGISRPIIDIGTELPPQKP